MEIKDNGNYEDNKGKTRRGVLINDELFLCIPYDELIKPEEDN